MIYIKEEDRAKAFVIFDVAAILVDVTTPQPSSQATSTTHIDLGQQERSVVY